jgi:hypothetical protein
MKLITSKNSQCVVAAFAMAMDTTVEALIEKLGHDGLEQIIDKDAPKPPACYRSFHPQEFVDILLSEGYACTMVELDPCLKHGHLLVSHGALLGTDRFFLSLMYGDGVLFGTIKEKAAHAVAWDHTTQKIFDPRGFTFRWNKDQDFHPKQFFLIQKVDESCMMKSTTQNTGS